MMKRLTDNIQSLVELYNELDLYSYTPKGKETIVQPSIVYELNNNFINDITIVHDKTKKYELPRELDLKKEYLLDSYSNAIVYDSPALRLDRFIENDDGSNSVILYTSETTYNNLLVTNRCLDYDHGNGSTSRKVFDNDVRSTLQNNRLSNNLGFHIMLESCDGYLPFVVRNKHVSIEQGKLANSITASLKHKYATDHNREFTLPGLKAAIIQEIIDELGLEIRNIESDIIDDLHMIGIYQDLVEGGKPAFLFHTILDIDKEQMTELFNTKVENVSKSKDIKSLAEIDGDKLVWVHKDDLDSVFKSNSEYTINNVDYSVGNTTITCTMMFIKYLARLQSGELTHVKKVIPSNVTAIQY